MNKNRKAFLFLGLTLLTLLISVSATSATDNNNDTTLSMHDVNTDKIIADSNSKVVQTQQKKEVKTESKNKNIKDNKTYKQPKKAVETTQTATDYETLKQSWNNIKNEGDNTTDYTINVKNGNYKFTEELTITNTSNIKSITINGEDTDKTIFDGQNKTRLFNLNTTTLKINFNNITFTNGFNDTKAGVIYTKSVMNINNSKFINNTVSNKTGDSYYGSNLYGGAIFTENTCTINNSYFIHNILENGYSSMGGAIFINGTNNETILLIIMNTEFIENGATVNSYAQGGAIASSKNTLFNISKCYFSDNKAIYYADILNDRYTTDHIQNITECVFENTNKRQNIVYIRGSYNVSYNYFVNKGGNSDIIKSDLVFLVNGQPLGKCFNQKTGNILNISLYKIDPYYYTTVSNMSLAKNYEFTLTFSNNNVLNLTNVKLTPLNNYSTIIKLDNLPKKFDDITIKMGDKQVAKIVCSETNVKFNNVKGKPGETVTLKAEFTNTDNLIQTGKVAFKINDNTIGHTQINFGIAQMNYTIPNDFRSKEYKLTVVYGGTSKIVEARKNAKLSLERLNTKTELKTTITGNNLKIEVNPRDENNQTITYGKICVKIEGKTLQNLNIKGKTTVNFTIPKSWNNREIRVLAIYGENSQYNTSRTEIKTKLTLPKTEVKEVKKDTIVNNYYVSNNGSDSNSGSVNSPFKTIQKAIDTVKNNKQAANIYLNGEFKGVGNTNLTIPGELYINFIGLGNSSINGEVNYTIAGEDGDYSWGSSAIWTTYDNATGNWAMTITRGSGLITINNMTIKNCWNPGGSNINAYPTSTVKNYGNLKVDNVSFIYNHGGVGASIRNTNGSNLTVLNSFFEANRKSSSTGNYGAGVYNNGTATIINCTFQKNYARWGTVTNDKNMTIINSTIRDNIGYDGGSTFKLGSGITINTGSSDFFDLRDIIGINTVINGCTFINNDQLDISVDAGNLNLTNNIFNKSTGVVSQENYKNYTDDIQINIINNTFDSPIGSSLYNSLSSTDKYILILRLQHNYNYDIENNRVLNVGGTNSKALELKSNHAIIRNNTFTRAISLTINNTQVLENNITTTKDDYAIVLGESAKNNTIITNHLVSSTYQGDGAVTYISGKNTIINNTPKVNIIRLNDETFYIYFDDDGNLKPEYADVQQIQIIASLNNKILTINNSTLNIAQKTTRIISYNTTIVTKENGYVNITGLKINNTNQQPVIIFNTDNNIITKSYFNTTNDYTVIINQTQNNTIENNNFIADLLVGDEATTPVNNNIINSNNPTYQNYLITDETYNQFFENDGTIKTTTLNETRDIRLILGNLNNKTLLLNNNRTITIKRYHDYTQNNITIKTENTKINMTNMSITNTNKKLVLDLNSKGNIIRQNNLTANANAIKIENETGIDFHYNNINVNSNEKVTAIQILNSNETDLDYNNITTIGNNSVKSIEILNSNMSSVDNNNIITTSNSNENNTSVYSINIINSENTYQNKMYGNIIKTSGINTYGINVENQILTINQNRIITNGSSSIGIRAVNSTLPRYNGGITGNSIISSSNTSIGILLKECRNLTVTTSNTINITGVNITGILLDQTRNMSINGTRMSLSGDKTTLIKLENTNQTNMTSNTMEAITKDKKIAPVQLINAEETNIYNNSIITTSEYAINIDASSLKSIITSNKLYASNMGDNAVYKHGNNKIEIFENLPEESLNYYLNNKTYDQFFDENGVLRENVPNKYNIILAGNLYDKILNITHAINITSEGVTSLINSTLIINANYTNITKINIQGENTKIIINADKTNMDIGTISAATIKSQNRTIITIMGNRNKVQVNSITGDEEGTQTSNLTIFNILGKQNNIKVKTITLRYFNNSTGVLLNNAKQNMINISSICASNVVILNNSNLNRIMLNSSNIYSNGVILSNSSNNIITATGNIINSNDDGSGKAIVIEDNSNNNLFMGIGINMYTDFNTPPVTITNSNNNTISNSNIQFKGNCYAIEIIEGENNTIQNNVIKSSSLSGNKAVYQYYNEESMGKNMLKNNNQSGPAYYTSIITRDIIKVGNTITLNSSSNYNYRNQKGYFTFYVNGKEIGTVEAKNSTTASINYTITGNEGDELLVDVAYYGGNYSSAVGLNSTSFAIIKMDSNIILPTVVNNGKMTNITAIILGEDGNIIYDGKVAFKVDQKTVGVVKITNGIAQISLDTSNYKLGEHEIYLIYGGNNQYAKSNSTTTLTINKYDAKINVEPVVVSKGSKTILKATVTDMSNTNVNTGKVIFKLNGKTLKDDKGNTITTEVKNGTATIEYMIPSNYSAKDYILTAVASDDKYNRIEANSTLTVTN